MGIVRESLGLTAVILPARMNVSERKTYSEPLAPELSSHLNTWMETLK